ncbi:MAG: hypothetical protein F4173_07265 [Acidobacteriia bacterium]|nr:hypothetical protein [Terriglobia bacterium]
MPPVTGRDQHCVDVSPFPQLKHVAEHLPVIVAVMLVDRRLDGFAAFVARIADRPELDIVLGQKRLEIALAPATDT